MGSDPRAAFLRVEDVRRLVPAVIDILGEREPADVAYLLREIAANSSTSPRTGSIWPQIVLQPTRLPMSSDDRFGMPLSAIRAALYGHSGEICAGAYVPTRSLRRQFGA